MSYHACRGCAARPRSFHCSFVGLFLFGAPHSCPDPSPLTFRQFWLLPGAGHDVFAPLPDPLKFLSNGPLEGPLGPLVEDPLKDLFEDPLEDHSEDLSKDPLEGLFEDRLK
jgi:hypothetical protein